MTESFGSGRPPAIPPRPKLAEAPAEPDKKAPTPEKKPATERKMKSVGKGLGALESVKVSPRPTEAAPAAPTEPTEPAVLKTEGNRYVSAFVQGAMDAVQTVFGPDDPNSLLKQAMNPAGVEPSVIVDPALAAEAAAKGSPVVVEEPTEPEPAPAPAAEPEPPQKKPGLFARWFGRSPKEEPKPQPSTEPAAKAPPSEPYGPSRLEADLPAEEAAQLDALGEQLGAAVFEGDTATAKKEVRAVQQELRNLPPSERNRVLQGTLNVGAALSVAANGSMVNISRRIGRAFDEQDWKARLMQGTGKIFGRRAENAKQLAAGDADLLSKKGLAKLGSAASWAAVGYKAWNGATGRALVLAGLNVAGTSMEVLKEARLANFDLREKLAEGRSDDLDAAAEEAWALYEEAQKAGGGKAPNAEALSNKLAERLPAELLARLEAKPAGVTSGVVERLVEKSMVRSLKKVQAKLDAIAAREDLSEEGKRHAREKLMKGGAFAKDWGALITDADRMITRAGGVDMLGYMARLSERGLKLARKVAVTTSLGHFAQMGWNSFLQSEQMVSADALPDGEDLHKGPSEFKKWVAVAEPVEEAEEPAAFQGDEDADMTAEGAVEEPKNASVPSDAEETPVRAEPATEESVTGTAEPEGKYAAVKKGSSVSGLLEELGVKDKRALRKLLKAGGFWEKGGTADFQLTSKAIEDGVQVGLVGEGTDQRIVLIGQDGQVFDSAEEAADAGYLQQKDSSGLLRALDAKPAAEDVPEVSPEQFEQGTKGLLNEETIKELNAEGFDPKYRALILGDIGVAKGLLERVNAAATPEAFAIAVKALDEKIRLMGLEYGDGLDPDWQKNLLKGMRKFAPGEGSDFDQTGLGAEHLSGGKPSDWGVNMPTPIGEAARAAAAAEAAGGTEVATSVPHDHDGDGVPDHDTPDPGVEEWKERIRRGAALQEEMRTAVRARHDAVLAFVGNEAAAELSQEQRTDLARNLIGLRAYQRMLNEGNITLEKFDEYRSALQKTYGKFLQKGWDDKILHKADAIFAAAAGGVEVASPDVPPNPVGGNAPEPSLATPQPAPVEPTQTELAREEARMQQVFTPTQTVETAPDGTVITRTEPSEIGRAAGVGGSIQEATVGGRLETFSLEDLRKNLTDEEGKLAAAQRRWEAVRNRNPRQAQMISGLVRRLQQNVDLLRNAIDSRGEM